jgi:6-phosphogluconolactonase (cycloisomerase 2 family)
MVDNAVSWFGLDSSAGVPAFAGIAQDGAGGVDGLAGAVSVAFSPGGRHAYAAGYTDDAVAWFSADSGTGDLVYGGMVKDGVGGVDGLNHPTCVSITPDGQHLYASGFADHAVAWFSRNGSTGALAYGSMVRDGVGGADGLAGADVIDVTPDGRFLYVYAGTDESVSWFSIDSATGALSFQGMLKDSVAGIAGRFDSSNLKVGPDGVQVYVNLFLQGGVAWFSIDSGTGALAFSGMVQNGVAGVDGLGQPRSIAFSPDGRRAFVIASAEDALSWYDRDSLTGALAFTGVLKQAAGDVYGSNSRDAVLVGRDGRFVYVAANNDSAITWFEVLEDSVSISAGPARSKEERFSLRICPNPFTAAAVITYHLPARARVRLVLFNLYGQRLAVLENRVQGPGNHSIAWNAEGRTSGVYVLKAEIGDKRCVRRVVVRK